MTYMDELLKDVARRSELLLKSKPSLERGLFREAAEFAEERLRSICGDVDARIVMGRALLGSGKREEAMDILGDVNILIEQWSALLETLEPLSMPGAPGKAAPKETAPGLCGPERRSEISDEFNTLTMAELFINQGHYEMAKKVLEEILERRADDTIAAEKLNYVSMILQKDGKVLSGAGRLRVSRELNRWLEKIRKKI